jgi:hypothetical protein
LIILVVQIDLAMINYPDITGLNSYLKEYISYVPTHMDLIAALDYSHLELLNTLNGISEEKAKYKYQPDKWSIKTLTMHLSDTERVFQYRAMAISRGETQNLPSFEENDYAANCYADELGFEQIVIEYSLVADSFRVLFENMKEENSQLMGTANGMKISPAIIGFINAGHRLHHLKVLKERYGV